MGTEFVPEEGRQVRSVYMEHGVLHMGFAYGMGSCAGGCTDREEGCR